MRSALRWARLALKDLQTPGVHLRTAPVEDVRLNRVAGHQQNVSPAEHNLPLDAGGTPPAGPEDRAVDVEAVGGVLVRAGVGVDTEAGLLVLGEPLQDPVVETDSSRPWACSTSAFNSARGRGRLPIGSVGMLVIRTLDAADGVPGQAENPLDDVTAPAPRPLDGVEHHRPAPYIHPIERPRKPQAESRRHGRRQAHDRPAGRPPLSDEHRTHEPPFWPPDGEAHIWHVSLIPDVVENHAELGRQGPFSAVLSVFREVSQQVPLAGVELLRGLQVSVCSRCGCRGSGRPTRTTRWTCREARRMPAVYGPRRHSQEMPRRNSVQPGASAVERGAS